MGIEPAIELTDGLLYEQTGQHLSDLQCCILQEVWCGQTYSAIATLAGYSEGHIKDVASQLWRSLSTALGERITKRNYRSRLKYWLQRAKHKVLSSLPHSPAPPLPPAPHFIGRTPALIDLDHLIAQGHKLIVIQGEGGLGKTTLAQQYLHRGNFELTLELLMAQETANITPIERILEEWLRQDLQVEPSQDFGINLDRLKRYLTQTRVGLLIDNLEPALDAHGQLIPTHRRYAEFLRVLATETLQSVTLITSRDRLCEPGIKVFHYRLQGLQLVDWQQFFTGSTSTPVLPALSHLHQAYGGNAKAMEILYGTIQTEFAGDVAAYWQSHQTDPLSEIDLANLVNSQLNRLESLDPEAYQLLCQLSCYRYQALPWLPLSAILAHLETAGPEPVRPHRHQQIVASLRNRSLLEVCQGQYGLHPVIRAAAIQRLRQGPDWFWANRTAACYWSDSISQVTALPDALQAFEAFYHWVAIADYEAAADVLLKSRLNQWQQFLPLASTLYRMGLLQPILAAIHQVLPHLAPTTHPAKRSELQNILGDVYWIMGKIQAAINCQQNTIAVTTALLQAPTAALATISTSRTASQRHYYLTMLNIDAHLSIGLYKIDLWELPVAQTYFETVITRAQDSQHAAWATKARIALALTQSYLGKIAVAQEQVACLAATFLERDNPQRSGRFAYFMQLLGQTYSNLGQFTQALALYQRVIAAAEASHYPQVKARALTGLAEIARHQGQIEAAYTYHAQAIQMLTQLAAQCDLAEAYFQAGLTALTSPSSSPSPWSANTCFQQAWILFSQIKAPYQQEKVKQVCPTAVLDL